MDRAAGTRDHQGVVALLASRGDDVAATICWRRKARAGARHAGAARWRGRPTKPGRDCAYGARGRSERRDSSGPALRWADRGGGPRASAGAVAHMPVARVTNLSRAMEELKAGGILAG